MANEIDILLTATDKTSGAVKSATVSLDDYNAALGRMIAQEKNSVVSENVTKQFKAMTEAEKDAFVATQNLTRAQEQLGKTGTESANATTQMAHASQLAGNIMRDLGQAYQAYQQVVQATVGTQAEYANEIRTIQQISGLSADATSRLIQVTDDYKISMGDLLTTQRELSKDGKTLSMDMLASVADKYNAATTQVEKNKVAQDNLGRSWKSYIELLQQGGDAIRAESAAVSDSMILTQQRIDDSREWEKSTDRVNDATQGLMMTLGGGTSIVTNFNNAWAEGIEGWTKFIAGVSGAIDAQTRQNEITQIASDILAEYGTHLEGADRMQRMVTNATEEQKAAALATATAQWEQSNATQETTKANEEYTPSAEEVAAANEAAAAAAEALTAKYQSLLAMTQSIASAERGFQKASEDLAAQRVKAAADVEAAEKNTWDMKGIEEAKSKLAEIDKKIADTATNYQAQTAQIIYSNLMTKLSVDGITDAEFNMAQQAGVTLGIFTQAQANEAIAINALTTQVANGKLGVDALGQAINALPDGKTISVIADLISSATGPDTRGSTSGNENKPGRAAGTIPGAAGGLTWVGETGRELVNLPRGSQVMSSPDSRKASETAAAKGPSINYEEMGRVIARALTSALSRSEFAR